MGEEEKDRDMNPESGINVEIQNNRKEPDKKEPDQDERSEHAEGTDESERGDEKDPVEALREEYEERLKEKEDRFLRLAAEFDNYKKRTARQFENMTISSAERIITPLLEVVDNFQRALESSENNSDYDSLKKGTELIYQQLQGILKREGVEEIEAVGQQFDPNLHEAMMQVESDEYDEGVIVQEMMKGYKIKDKVIRHSRVVVSKGVSAKGDSETEDS